MAATATNRLVQRLSSSSAGLVPYITAGDGGLDRTLAVLEACCLPKVACVELGVPFTDPIADGPVLQAAADRALATGTTLTGVLETLEAFRRGSQLPVAIFSYANPLVRMGIEDAMSAVAQAGGDAVILPDVPVEEAPRFAHAAQDAGLCMVLFTTPTTRNDRLARIIDKTTGFLYVVGRTGVTGGETSFTDDLEQRLSRVRTMARTPVALGFGIKRPDQVKWVLSHADLAIVGSALVDRLHHAEDPAKACRSYLQELLPEDEK